MKTLELKKNFAAFSCCGLLGLGTLKTFPGLLEMDEGRSILTKTIPYVANNYVIFVRR